MGIYEEFHPDRRANNVLVGFGLGVVFGLGLGLYYWSNTIFGFGLFMALMPVYHLWEYNWVAMFHPMDLHFNSFLLNQSTEFMAMMSICTVEFWIEWLFFGFKGNSWLIHLALIVAVIGQFFRSLSMFTAGRNFTHQVAETKKTSHTLVKTGVYAYLRHPSYFGWFWWSIAVQLILENPISLCIAAYASWKFFSERIEFEESKLIDFFGDEYVKYKKDVMVGIPGIK